MPFLAIFRKDKDKDSRSKTPVPTSPAPPSVSSRKSSSFSRARPSFASSRSCVSPPPQLANISPASDFEYVLPELDATSLVPELAQVPEEPVKPKRALPFGKRRGSASSGMIVSGTATPVARPFSEALDTFMARKQTEDAQDRDPDRARDGEAPTSSTLSDPISITSKNVNVTSSGPSTPNTRQTTTTTTALELDSDDVPLIPPPTRASVFGGYAYSDRDKPTRSQSLPDIDQDTDEQDEMVRSEHGHSRPSRPQVHPHQLARGKNKSVDLNSLLASTSAPVVPPAPASDTSTPVKSKKDASKSGGLFGWRSKSSKEVPAASQPAPIVTADPAESSFSLKSFRHVGPASSIPSSPVQQPGSAFASSTNVNSAGISANTSSTAIPSAGIAAVSTPPSSYGRSSPAPGARPVPGRTGVTRERVNSTGSEGVMTAGLFRQAARRSNTNLVEDGGTSPRSSLAMGVRDREKRGPPTRSWADKDGDGSSMSGSDLPPVRPPRTRPPEGVTSDRSNLGLGHKPHRSLGRSTSAMPAVGGGGGDEPSTFANALSQLGEESPLARSGLGQGGARADYAKYGVRSDGALRSVSAAAVPTRAVRPSASTMPQPSVGPGPQPATTRPGHQAGRPSIQSINVRPEMRGVNARPMPMAQQSPVTRPSPPSSQGSISRPGPGPQGINSSSNSRPGPQSSQPRPGPGPQSPQSRPGPQSPQSRPSPQSARSSSPTKPRQSAPTAMGRSPMRTTIPTKTNDGPSIKPRASSPIKMPRPPSPARSNRSISSSPTKSVPSSPTKSVLSGSPALPLKSSMRQPTSPSHSRYASVDTFRAKSPSGTDMHRAKSPSFSVDMTRTRARSPAFEVVSRTKSPAPSALSTRAKSPAPSAKSRVGYVPPPRQSSLVAPVDSDSDESEPEGEAESESEELGFGEKKGVGAMRGRGPGANASSSSGHGHEGLTRERTITQRTAGTGSGQTSPVRDDDQPPKPPPKHGVSLFDRPTPSFDKSSSSSLSDRYGTPPARNAGPGRSRASHSTSAISAAATARNSAALADANRRVSGHTRGASTATAGRPSHIRSPAEATDTDEDDDEDDKSETDSEDNAPLSALAPPRRPGSSASAAPAPSMARSFGRPLVDLSGPNGAPPRPPRRVPGVGVTRNSSLRGSRSVEDLGRMTMAPGPVVGGAARAGPRAFIASPPSSTGDSSSGKAPLTPRDGSEAGIGTGRRVGSALGPAGDEARRKERRRSEAKASVELGNVINGPGPLDDDNEDSEHVSAHHPQMGPGGMGMMGWNQPGLFPQMTGGFPGFPSSQSMPFGGSQFPGPQFPASQSMPFIPPPPPPGASESYIAAHQQALMMAKQAYLSAVAQQAMMIATEQWERSSNAGGSVYGGSQMGGMSMMGGPMMGMYANSAYAASMYEGSVVGGGGAGWGSASAYGGGGGGGRSAYGGGAKSEYGGGMKSSPTKSTATPTRNRARAHTATAQTPAPANRERGNPVPPSTWNTRRKTDRD